MANGDTIDRIGKVLEGKENIPNKVSNQMILIAMMYDRDERKKLEERVDVLEKVVTRIKFYLVGTLGLIGLDKFAIFKNFLQ